MTPHPCSAHLLHWLRRRGKAAAAPSVDSHVLHQIPAPPRQPNSPQPRDTAVLHDLVLTLAVSINQQTQAKQSSSQYLRDFPRCIEDKAVINMLHSVTPVSP